jgi:hypothetical protein
LAVCATLISGSQGVGREPVRGGMYPISTLRGMGSQENGSHSS